MDLFVSQISEASSSINPFDTPMELQEHCDCLGQNKIDGGEKKQVFYTILGTHTVLGH